MSLFRVYVDGTLFYHPQMSKLAIAQAQVQEDAESILYSCSCSYLSISR